MDAGLYSRIYCSNYRLWLVDNTEAERRWKQYFQTTILDVTKNIPGEHDNLYAESVLSHLKNNAGINF